MRATACITQVLDHDVDKCWPIKVKQTEKTALGSKLWGFINKPLILHWFWELFELFLVIKITVYSSSAS